MHSVSDYIVLLGLVGLLVYLGIMGWVWANNPPPPKPTPAEMEARAAAELAEFRRNHAGPFGSPAVEWEVPQRRGSQWTPRRPYNHEEHLL